MKKHKRNTTHVAFLVARKSIWHPLSTANNKVIETTDIFQFRAFIHSFTSHLHINSICCLRGVPSGKEEKMANSSDSGVYQQMSLDLLPSALLATVMTKLDIASIRSLACTCKAFHSCASYMLCFIPNFHLLVSLFLVFFLHDLAFPWFSRRVLKLPWHHSYQKENLFLMFVNMTWHQFSLSKLVCSYQDIAPSADFLRPLIPPNPYIRSLKVDCMRLDDSSLDYLLQPTLQELCLHNCADFSGRLLSQVGQYCKDLRLSLFFSYLSF